MTTRLIALALCAVCTTGLLAEEPKLANPKQVFPTSQPVYKRANQNYAFAMRLSPDGKRVLYTRPIVGKEAVDERSARFERVLRELDGGKEAVLPGEPLETGWRTVCTRFNLFDRDGKRLVVPDIKVESREVDGGATSITQTVKWAMYDIAQAKTADIDLAQGVQMVKFAADGQALLVSAGAGPRGLATRIISLKDPKAKPTPLTASGFVQSICPAGEVVAFFVPPSRPAGPPKVGEAVERPPARLVLWDLKTDKELTLLPTHLSNTVLDDCETQWTPDGRFLYYRDFVDAPADGEANRKSLRNVTRIWDRQAEKPVKEILDAMPSGPGPGPSQMVLTRTTKDGSRGFFLHDAATGKEYPLADGTKSLIHAYGGKVLYAEKTTGSDAEAVFSADVVVPKATE